MFSRSFPDPVLTGAALLVISHVLLLCVEMVFLSVVWRGVQLTVGHIRLDENWSSDSEIERVCTDTQTDSINVP